MPMSSPGFLESNRTFEGVGTSGSSYSSSMGMSLKGVGLAELVLVALEACRLCCVGMGCYKVDYLREASSAFTF